MRTDDSCTRMARRSDDETEGAPLELVTTDGFRSGVHGAALTISPSISFTFCPICHIGSVLN